MSTGPADPSNPLEKSPNVTPAPSYGPDQKEIGSEDENQKQFQLPEEAKGSESTSQAARQSPMELARDSVQGSQRMSPQELNENINHLQNHLNDVSKQLQNPSVANKMTDDHLNAMTKLIGKMNPDMRTIANHSKGEFHPGKVDNNNVLGSVVKWINGSQQTLGGAMNYLGHMKQPSMASFMKLQWSVQRASQRAELFSSIIGSSVSGIKTIMSTQLG